jgi:hypothetical protein
MKFWAGQNSLCLGVSIVLLASSSVFANGIEDYYHQSFQQRFFDYGKSARATGTAGASGVTTTDSTAILSNPAGIGMMKDADVSAHYSYEQLSGRDIANYQNIEQESDNGSVLGATPLGPRGDSLPDYGNLGIGWIGEHRSSNDVADSDARGSKMLVAYGKAISDDTSLGYSVSYNRDKFKTGASEARMTDGVKQTVGILHKLGTNTSFGATASYGFGESEQALGGFFDPSGGARVKRDLTSYGVEAGLSHKYESGIMTAFSSDYVNYDSDYDDANSWNFRLGAEKPVADWLSIRAGYRYALNRGFDSFDDSNQNAKYNAVGFGAGLPLSKNLNIDYGAEYRHVGEGDWTHMVSLAVPFSICRD